MKLTERIEILQDTFEYNGEVVEVDMAFDTVLKFFELMNDNLVDDIDKIILGLRLMLPFYDISSIEDFDELQNLFKFILIEFLDIDLDNEDELYTKKVIDFEKDADLIFVSFFSEFNIDLFKFQGKLHWKKFIAMLNHLNEKTALKTVIGYRMMKIPKKSEASDDYIKHVKKMKKIYSLKDDNFNCDTELSSLASRFTKGV